MLHKQYYGLGTAINLTVAEPATEADLTAGYQLIQHYEDLLTVNRDQSEVMSINHAAGDHAVGVSPITYQLIKKAVAVSAMHLGFNVAIGPLVKLWAIGFDGANLPKDTDIQERLQLIDPANIELNDERQTVFLTKKGMELDLGAIAKGYIADAIKTLWLTRGVKTGIIDLGGNILLVGPSTHDDLKWRVGIQSPDEKRDVPAGVLNTVEKSLVTSGIYERFLVINGQEYHHMFDSHTGYPIKNDLASVTIVSNQSIDGDIWTTQAFYQGIEKGPALIEAQPSLEAVFVTRNHEVAVTSGITDTFRLVDSEYHMINTN